jgi:EAL domain-containing protein (putative c-di-GMP-specific phosphodiesterase class I)
MVDIVRRELGLEVAFISAIEGDQRTFRSLVAEVELPIEVGFTEPYEGTYCQMITSGQLGEVVPDTAAEPLTKDAFHTDHLGIGAYLGVPMRRRDGELFGTLCAFSRHARPELSAAEAEVLRATGVLIMRLIEVEEEVDERLTDLADLAATVDDALAGATIDLLPVLDVRDGVVVGHEAVARFGDGRPFRQRLGEAREIGRGVELELSVLRRTLEAVEETSVPVVSVSLSAEALKDPAFQAIISGMPPSRLMLRFDVDEEVTDYEELIRLLQPLRRLGARVAVDRVGDGSSDLRHILMLSPDVLRIDPDLVRGLDADPGRRVLVESIATLAAKIDADCVALGVASDADLAWMDELGVTHVVRLS